MLTEEQRKSLTEAASHYRENMDELTSLFLAERGIPESVAKKYGLGTVTDPLPNHGHLEGWLSIPYYTANKTVVGFKFRRLDDGKPKYGQAVGQKTHLYNVTDILTPSSMIVVCEGELDTIIISGMLGIPAVGCPGVSNWKPHYSRLLEGYQKIMVVGDNDGMKEDGSNPGAEFNKRLTQELSEAVAITLPEGMDINDVYLTEGTEGLMRKLGVTSE